MREAIVFYEDQDSEVGGDRYMLHQLVLRMAGSRLPTDWTMRQRLNQVAGRPSNGVSELLTHTRKKLFANQFRQRLVLLDSDRIANQLGLKGGADEAAIVSAIKARAVNPETLQVFFLHPNMEGLLSSIHSCNPDLVPYSLERKKRQERDLILQGLVRSKSDWDCVQKHQPGLAKLVEALVSIVSTPR